MQFARTERFKRAYQHLTAQEQERLKKALTLMAENLRHPSLQVKKIKGTARVWEARVSLSCRMTFEFDGETIILRNVGEHDATLKNP